MTTFTLNIIDYQNEGLGNRKCIENNKEDQ